LMMNPPMRTFSPMPTLRRVEIIRAAAECKNAPGWRAAAGIVAKLTLRW
jgi:hypothetical protein